MKKLVCELCGSNNLLKENGVFVCQSCGTQYSVEEARKMMIEGTVNVQGVVQVDNSSQIENYYRNARRAMAQEDWAGVEKYYDLVLQNEPGSIEAIFYSAYGRVNLSLYDADINKRRQIFNVLVNNTLLIAKVYSVENRDSCKRMIEMIHQDILKITDSSFVYNSTKNQYGMTLFTDKGETKKLFNALEHAFVDALDSIMQADPQEWLCQMILQHSNLQLRADTANKDFYNDKIKKANSWLTRQKIQENIVSNEELQNKYSFLKKEYEELSQKYIPLKENVDKLTKGKLNQTKLKKAIQIANSHIDLMTQKKSEIDKFLSENGINDKETITLPPKIKIESIPEYRHSRINVIGIIAFIVSILALISICFYGIGFIIAPISIILSLVAIFIPKKNKGFAIASIVTNGIIVLFFLCLVLLLILAYDSEHNQVFTSKMPTFSNRFNNSSEEDMNELHEVAVDLIYADTEDWFPGFDLDIEYVGNNIGTREVNNLVTMIYKVDYSNTFTDIDGISRTLEDSYYFYVQWIDITLLPGGDILFDSDNYKISRNTVTMASDFEYYEDGTSSKRFVVHATGQDSWEDAVSESRVGYVFTNEYFFTENKLDTPVVIED